MKEEKMNFPNKKKKKKLKKNAIQLNKTKRKKKQYLIANQRKVDENKPAYSTIILSLSGVEFVSSLGSCAHFVWPKNWEKIEENRNETINLNPSKKWKAKHITLHGIEARIRKHCLQRDLKIFGYAFESERRKNIHTYIYEEKKMYSYNEKKKSNM